MTRGPGRRSGEWVESGGIVGRTGCTRSLGRVFGDKVYGLYDEKTVTSCEILESSTW